MSERRGTQGKINEKDTFVIVLSKLSNVFFETNSFILRKKKKKKKKKEGIKSRMATFSIGLDGKK